MAMLLETRARRAWNATLGTSVALSIGLALAAASASAGAQTTQSPLSDQSVVATIGQTPITQAQVIAQSRATFDQAQQEYDREVRQLQSNFAQARHQLLEKQLDSLLDHRALEMEAKALGLSTEKVLEGVKVPVVTDAEVRDFFDANKARTTMTYEQLQDRIRQYLANQHNDQATHDFYQQLRVKYAIHSLLEPYRVEVAATGPVRGRTDAPVTIVEFGDFQCPYCKEAEATLKLVLAKYPQQVRLVFRELPLTQVHPNAMNGAEAGVCADQQGRFWAMHDAMYADQDALTPMGLQTMAKSLGLDPDRLAACMTDSATAQRIHSDMQAADDLGIGATPYFFVDGRPINGSVPPEQFESVISDELSRLGAHVAGGPPRGASRG